MKRKPELPSDSFCSGLLNKLVMKEIQLTQGKVALIDDKDYDYLNQWKWYAANHNYTFYACRMIYVNDKRKVSFMHREILNTPLNKQVDHIDHNGLNNQRNNIRICSVSQNHMNKKPIGFSQYLGVFYDKKYIRAAIKYAGKYHYLGMFKTEKDAALAYNNAAKKYHGEFANLNII